jgi:uncharacterized protein YxeA
MKNILKKALIVFIIVSINSVIWNAIDNYLLREEFSSRLKEQIHQTQEEETEDSDDYLTNYLNNHVFTSDDEV